MHAGKNLPCPRWRDIGLGDYSTAVNRQLTIGNPSLAAPFLRYARTQGSRLFATGPGGTPFDPGWWRLGRVLKCAHWATSRPVTPHACLVSLFWATVLVPVVLDR